jgi:hypothetical protein
MHGLDRRRAVHLMFHPLDEFHHGSIPEVSIPLALILPMQRIVQSPVLERQGACLNCNNLVLIERGRRIRDLDLAGRGDGGALRDCRS